MSVPSARGVRRSRRGTLATRRERPRASPSAGCADSARRVGRAAGASGVLLPASFELLPDVPPLVGALFNLAVAAGFVWWFVAAAPGARRAAPARDLPPPPDGGGGRALGAAVAAARWSASCSRRWCSCRASMPVPKTDERPSSRRTCASRSRSVAHAAAGGRDRAAARGVPLPRLDPALAGARHAALARDPHHGRGVRRGRTATRSASPLRLVVRRRVWATSAYTTRSIWPSVVLHGAYNALARAAERRAARGRRAHAHRLGAHADTIFWPRARPRSRRARCCWRSRYAPARRSPRTARAAASPAGSAEPRRDLTGRPRIVPRAALRACGLAHRLPPPLRRSTAPRRTRPPRARARRAAVRLRLAAHASRPSRASLLAAPRRARRPATPDRSCSAPPG